jgi:hypothetical protein
VDEPPAVPLESPPVPELVPELSPAVPVPSPLLPVVDVPLLEPPEPCSTGMTVLGVSLVLEQAPRRPSMAAGMIASRRESFMTCLLYASCSTRDATSDPLAAMFESSMLDLKKRSNTRPRHGCCGP